MTLRTLVLLAPIWPACGCTGGTTQPGNDLITGTIRFDGKPLTYGSIEFYDAGGNHKKTFIGTDGSYRMANTFDGEVKVVITLGPPPVPVAAPSGAHGKKIEFEEIDLPARYRDPEKTDLRYKVSKGSNRIDIDLKPDPKK
jgi:hypothetical protein